MGFDISLPLLPSPRHDKENAPHDGRRCSIHDNLPAGGAGKPDPWRMGKKYHLNTKDHTHRGPSICQHFWPKSRFKGSEILFPK